MNKKLFLFLKGNQRTDGLYGAFIVYKPNVTSSTPSITHEIGIDLSRPIDSMIKSPPVYEKEYYMFVQDWNHRMSDVLFKFPLWKNFKFTRGYTNASCENRMRLDDGSILPTVPPDSVMLFGNFFDFQE